MSSSESVPLQEPPRRTNLFLGENGLRSGWGLAIFIALMAFTLWLASSAMIPIARHFGRDSAYGMILSEGLLFVAVLVPTAIMALIERRPMGVYGLPLRAAFRRHFWSGALWGFINLSLVMLCMIVVGVYTIGGIDLPVSGILKYGALWALGFLLVGFSEEYLFRGYLLYNLTSGIGFWPTTIILSVLFALAHAGNPGENWVGLLGIFEIAIFFCLTVQRTGTLWFAVGIHMAYDWGESFFYSVPDSGTYIRGHLLHAKLMGSKWLSGGSVGPEASVFAFLADLAMLILFIVLYRQRRFPPAKANVQQPAAAETPEPGIPQ